MYLRNERENVREDSNEGYPCEKCNRVYVPQTSCGGCPYCELDRLQTSREQLREALVCVCCTGKASGEHWTVDDCPLCEECYADLAVDAQAEDIDGQPLWWIRQLLDWQENVLLKPEGADG